VRLWVGKQVLLQLILAIEFLTTQRAAVRPSMNHPVLDQIRPRREPLVAQMTRVRPVTEMQVLMLHENMFVAEASVAYGALIGLLSDVRQPNVSYQAVLITKLFATERTLECAVVRRRRLGQQQQVGGRYLR